MDRESKSQIIVKICCVLAAFCLWLYITYVENPIKTYSIKNIPVQLINKESVEKSKLSVLPEQKFNITLNVKVTSSDLYLAKAEQFKVVADIGAYVLKKGENRIPVQITESPSQVVIENNDKLWINVRLDDLLEKSVMVTPQIDGSAKDGFFSMEPIVSPNSVIISGAAAYVNQVAYVEAKGNIENIDKSTTLTLPIQAKNSSGNLMKEVNIQPNVVQVKLPIKKEKTVPIMYKSTGELKDNLVVKNLMITPSTVKIIGDEQDINKIKFINTKPIDISKIEKDTVVEAELDLPENIFTLSNKNTVDVKLTVDRIIKKDFNVSIEFKNIKNGYTITSDKKEIKISVLGEESIINKITDGEIKGTVDVQLAEEGQYNLPIDISLPEGIENESKDGQKVNVKVEKTKGDNEKQEENNAD